LHELTPKADVRENASTRPFGVKALATIAAISLFAAPIVIRGDFSRHAPGWEVASHIFNFALCAALSIGLWRLDAWARVLAEVTSFLVPLNVLPSLLRPTNHRVLVLGSILSALMYAAWSNWYLRRPEVVRAFEGPESPQRLAIDPELRT
jgi:hypothetical protein